MATTYTFTGLTNGTTYTFEVRAVNSYGNGAAASVQRVPVSAGTMAAIPGDGSVIISWMTPPAVIGRITDYWVRCDDTTWVTPPDEDYLHTFYGLVNGVTHTFDLWGIGMDGSSQRVLFSASAEAMPVGKPQEPANLAAVPGNGQITLNWGEVYSDEGNPIVRYEVSQDGGASWVPVGMDMTHTFAGLVNGTAYSLQVRAVNAIGAGDVAAVSATPRQPPAMTSVNSKSFPYGSGGTFTVSASGTLPIAYALSGQPGGVSVNATTGSVTVGKAVPAGVYPFTVTAANGTPPDAVQNFTLTITRFTPQLSDLQYTAPSNRTYDGASVGIGPVTDKNAVGLSCTVYYQGVSGTVYPRSQTPPKDVGQYDVIAAIAGSTNINEAELSLGSYRILAKTITFAIAGISPQTYTGSAITPEPEVKDGSTVLIKNVDFTYSYSSNTNTGISAAVNLTGIGNYAGSTGSAIFSINKAAPPLMLTATPAATQARPGSVALFAALPTDATGTLTFKAGADTIAAVTLPMKTTTFTPTGAANAYSFTVEYSGDSNYEGKTSRGASLRFYEI